VFSVNTNKDFIFFIWTPWRLLSEYQAAIAPQFTAVEPIVWNKLRVPIPAHKAGLVNSFEMGLLCFAGNRPRDSTVYLFDDEEDRYNTISCPISRLLTTPSRKVVNVCQKPVALMSWFVKHFSREGQWVLDLCSGTGMYLFGCPIAVSDSLFFRIHCSGLFVEPSVSRLCGQQQAAGVQFRRSNCSSLAVL
jgi:hypothetical protein